MTALVHPGLLWTGLGLVSVPILIHIFFRRQHRVIRWAAMHFLLRALKKQKRRLQIENLILLILRCAMLALLGLALARPAVQAAAVAQLTGGGPSLVLVMDTSTSMGARHTGRRALDRARERATTILDELSSSSQVTLIVTRDDLAGGGPRAPIQKAKPSDVRARLAALTVSNGPNHLAEVFRMVRQKIRDLRGRRTIIFITDLQRRDWYDTDVPREDLRRTLRSMRLEGEEEATPITIVDVGTESIANVAITEFTKEPGRELFAGTLSGLIVKLTNYGQRDVSGVVTLFKAPADPKAAWEKKSGVDIEIKRSADIGPGTYVSKKIHLRLEEADVGLTRFKIKFESKTGGSDRLAKDSERYVALRVRPAVRFLPVTTAASALTIFRNAVYEGGPIELATRILPEDLSTIDLSSTDVVLWADAENHQFDEAGARNLERFVKRGGGLLAYVGDKGDPARFNTFFFKERGEGLFPMRFEDDEKKALVSLDEESLVRFDTQTPIAHPLFREMTQDPAAQALFYSPEVRFFRVVEECPPENVIARYTTAAGDPAVIEHRLGRGRVLIVTTTPDERGFRLNGSLMPMILFFEAAHYLVAENVGHRNVLVGWPIKIELQPGVSEATLTPPEEAGGPTTQPIDSTRKEIVLDETAQPGFYSVVLRGPGSDATKGLVLIETHLAAVNIDATEGDLRRIDSAPRQLRSSYPGASLRFAEDEGEALDEATGASKGEIGQALLLIVGIFLFLELLLAWRFGSRRRLAR